MTPAGITAQSMPADWRADVSVTYSAGDYGSSPETKIWNIPFTITRYLRMGAVYLSVPLVSVETDSTERGIGDAVLKGRYYAISQEGPWPGADLVAKAKLPTADEKKGLGTGEFDAGAAAEVYRQFDSRFLGFFDLGYNVIGDPPDVNYKNQLVFDIGCSYVGNPPWSHTIYYDYYSKIAPDGDNILSVSYAVGYKLNRRWKLYGVVEKGLSDGAPDYALTAGVGRYF